MLFYNLHAMYNDTNYWKDPSIFRPERFLNESGEIDQMRSERVLNTVFGVGNWRDKLNIELDNQVCF